MGWLRCVTLLLLPVWFPHGPPNIQVLGWCHFDSTWLTGVSNPRPILSLVTRALWMSNIGPGGLILGSLHIPRTWIFIGESYKIALFAICYAKPASICFSTHFECHRASKNRPKSYVWTDANVPDAVLRTSWHTFRSKTRFRSSVGDHNKTKWHSFLAFLEEILISSRVNTTPWSQCLEFVWHSPLLSSPFFIDSSKCTADSLKFSAQKIVVNNSKFSRKKLCLN